jgi:hypothetical protein
MFCQKILYLVDEVAVEEGEESCGGNGGKRRKGVARKRNGRRGKFVFHREKVYENVKCTHEVTYKSSEDDLYEAVGGAVGGEDRGCDADGAVALLESSGQEGKKNLDTCELCFLNKI